MSFAGSGFSSGSFLTIHLKRLILVYAFTVGFGRVTVSVVSFITLSVRLKALSSEH